MAVCQDVVSLFCELKRAAVSIMIMYGFCMSTRTCAEVYTTTWQTIQALLEQLHKGGLSFIDEDTHTLQPNSSAHFTVKTIIAWFPLICRQQVESGRWHHLSVCM